MKRKNASAGPTPRKPRKAKELGRPNPTPEQQAARVAAGLEPLLIQRDLDTLALSARILQLEIELGKATKKRKKESTAPKKRAKPAAPVCVEIVDEVPPTHRFTNRLGVDIVLPRYARTAVKLTDDQHAERLCESVKLLAAHNIKPTSKNIKALGIGAGTIQRFRSKVKELLLEAKQQAKQNAMDARERSKPLVPYRMSSEDESDESDSESDVDIITTRPPPRPKAPAPKAPLAAPSLLPYADEWPLAADLGAWPLSEELPLLDFSQPDWTGQDLLPLPDLPPALAETMNQRPYLMGRPLERT